MDEGTLGEIRGCPFLCAMKETDLNRIIARNLNERYWGYKIPDPQQASATSSSERPFDGVGLLHDRPIYFESKFQKGYKAFNFSHIREHQLRNLLAIKNSSSDWQTHPATVLVVGAWEARKYFHLFWFEIGFINYLIQNGKKSILKREFELLMEAGLYLEIKKQQFDVDRIGEVTIDSNRYQTATEN